MWEYDADENRFGTPEALMLLPYCTGGCIDSMEGLLFESSTTTPYHFLNQAELSPAPSDPMVGLPYGGLDVPLGIEHLQLLGVRYFMAFSPTVVQAARADPSLTLVATTGPWRSDYNGRRAHDDLGHLRGADSAPVVAPLDLEPAVLTGVGPGQATLARRSRPTWYDDPSRWDVELAAGGPAGLAAGDGRGRRAPAATPGAHRPRSADVVETDRHHQLPRRPGRAPRSSSRSPTSPTGRRPGRPARGGSRPT